MASNTERKALFVVLLAFILLITIPYYFAHKNAGEGRVFGGFLLNPIDGYSYLAKMRQGYEQSWLFTLPYSADPGAGTAINLYYLVLGHSARVIGASLLFTFHAARVLGALLLGWSLYKFFSVLFADTFARLLSLTLTLFGSGLGWLAITQGFFTSDFWVAETYPFLSSYANAHFPLGLALQVWLLTPPQAANGVDRTVMFKLAGAALLLSLIYPFGWVIVVAVLTAWLAWIAWHRTDLKTEIFRWLCVFLGGGPYALYQLWVVRNHPVLSQWDLQNITPAPLFVDLVVSLSPALLLALIGILLARNHGETKIQFLIAWLIAGLFAIYLPIGLQRRMISGLFIPIAGMAVFAIQKLIAKPRRFVLAGVVLFLLSFSTNLLILAGGFQAARSKSQEIFVYESELQAFAWFDANAQGALVLAAPDSGLLIPAYSSARVIYGHPFETVDAEAHRQFVAAFFSGDMNIEEAVKLLNSEDIDFILFGPRERALGNLPSLPGWQIVFESGQTQIWMSHP